MGTVIVPAGRTQGHSPYVSWRLPNHNDDNGDNVSDAVTPVSDIGLPA